MIYVTLTVHTISTSCLIYMTCIPYIEEFQAKGLEMNDITSYKALGIALEPKHGTACHESALPDWTLIQKVRSQHLPYVRN